MVYTRLTRMTKTKTRLWIWLLVAAMVPSAFGQQSNVWALVVGVSQFRHLPADQQLEFAAKDAQAFAKFLASPRGGGLPEGNIKLLLNESAGVGALRRNLATWLPRNARPNDVVYIFLATHGIVEQDAAKASFILGSDADPHDLYTSAIPMSELDQIFSQRLGKVGRIVLLADLAQSGTIGVHTSLAQVAGKRRELIGLLATRGTESSQAGPQFCGGHGAFTCFLLKGLDGAADADKNNFVTVPELVDYVSEQLLKATDNRQHLQNFGAFDKEVTLSYVDKPGQK